MRASLLDVFNLSFRSPPHYSNAHVITRQVSTSKHDRHKPYFETSYRDHVALAATYVNMVIEALLIGTMYILQH